MNCDLTVHSHCRGNCGSALQRCFPGAGLARLQQKHANRPASQHSCSAPSVPSAETSLRSSRIFFWNSAVAVLAGKRAGPPSQGPPQKRSRVPLLRSETNIHVVFCHLSVLVRRTLGRLPKETNLTACLLISLSVGGV